ncbi:phosphate ABC transporter substrate-binding protein PstS [Crocosphaera sp. Alani8]|uniref:phosphate ABC transporter substrate-binding protein PstS n=1 Tax=Crocosphaera sp. Alani8 TaxID=3038952 RepID=UPI00313DBC45
MFTTVKSSKRTIITSLSILSLAIGLGACGGGSSDTSDTSTTPDGGGETTAALAPPLEGDVALTGAGASFPAPLYQNWFVQLNRAVPQLKVNYQSVGSGAGVEQFTSGTVDFGASDVAMTDEEIAAIEKGTILLPVTAGSIVVAYNLPGVEGLKLSREAYVGMFNGTVPNWNDPLIADANPDLELPDQPITVVHRSDGSGTTGVFTKHLSSISPEWEASIGQGKSVEWPTDKGNFIGGKGNEGVTASIQQNEGSVGYIEYGYAKQNSIPVAELENSSGNFIAPTDESASATLDAVTLPENLRAFITDPEGDQSYPIVTYTWILAYETYDDPQKAIAVESMIQYALTEGQEQSKELGYVPLPPSVREKVAAAADVISPDYEIKLN